jgi:hypothetical protein
MNVSVTQASKQLLDHIPAFLATFERELCNCAIAARFDASCLLLFVLSGAADDGDATGAESCGEADVCATACCALSSTGSAQTIDITILFINSPMSQKGLSCSGGKCRHLHPEPISRGPLPGWPKLRYRRQDGLANHEPQSIDVGDPAIIRLKVACLPRDSD